MSGGGAAGAAADGEEGELAEEVTGFAGGAAAVAAGVAAGAGKAAGGTLVGAAAIFGASTLGVATFGDAAAAGGTAAVLVGAGPDVRAERRISAPRPANPSTDSQVDSLPSGLSMDAILTCLSV